MTPKTACVERAEQIDNQLRALAHHGQCKAEQDREQQHLQDVALRERVDDGVRNDVHQEVGHALRFGLAGVVGDSLRIQRRRIDVESAAGLHHVPDHQADQQSDGGDDFKIEQSLSADAPHLLHVLHSGDPGDHRAEDHQSDDHGDQANERVAERLHGDRFGGADVAEDDRDRDAEQYLSREALIDRRSCGFRVISGVMVAIERAIRISASNLIESRAARPIRAPDWNW